MYAECHAIIYAVDRRNIKDSNEFFIVSVYYLNFGNFISSFPAF